MVERKLELPVCVFIAYNFCCAAKMTACAESVNELANRVESCIGCGTRNNRRLWQLRVASVEIVEALLRCRLQRIRPHLPVFRVVRAHETAYVTHPLEKLYVGRCLGKLVEERPLDHTAKLAALICTRPAAAPYRLERKHSATITVVPIFIKIFSEIIFARQIKQRPQNHRAYHTRYIVCIRA